MITRAEIVRSLRAAWLLFADGRNAIKAFDTSADGFWNSFQAIILVVPLYAFTVLADEVFYEAHALAEGTTFDSGTFYLARAVTLALDWVTLPVLLAFLAPFLGIGAGGYSAYVVARNWGYVLAVAVLDIVSLIALSGVFEGDTILIPVGLWMGVVLRYSYLTARRALGVPIDVAIGFVVLDFLVSQALSAGVSYLFGVAG